MSDWFRKHRHLYPDDWDEISTRIKEKAGWKCEVCQAPHGPPPCVLTTDHLDFNPANCSDDNLMALCQRCHLRRQAMNPPPRTREAVLKRMKPKGKQLCLPLPNYGLRHRSRASGGD